MTSVLKPKHPHDCNRCVLLGAHVFNGVWHDLYHCPSANDEGTLIARHGANGRYAARDVNSPWPSISSQPLNTARRLAQRQGHIPPDEEET